MATETATKAGQRWPLRNIVPLALVMLVAGTARAQAPGTPAAPTPPRTPDASMRTLPRVSLADAVHRALARNPGVVVADEEIRRAEGLSKQVRATWWPTFTANGTYTRLDGDRELQGRVVLNANQLSANLALAVPLVASRQWVQYARAKEAIDLAHLTAADARREVAVATARAYLTVLAQKRVVDTAERAFATARAHEEFAKTRQQGGIGNRLDAVRAAQERATTEARLKTARISVIRSQEALGVLLGQESPIDVQEDVTLPASPNREAAYGDAEFRRSDVAAQRERVEIARRSERDSWTDYMPTLSGLAQPFYQNPATFTQPITGWQAQLVLSIPLFDGGARYGLAEDRSAQHAQAKARLEGALRQVRSEVRVAFDAMTRADDALVFAREASRLATEALELAQLAYRAGATTNIEVIDAERRAQEAEIHAVVAEDASRQARVDLLAASGRFP